MSIKGQIQEDYRGIIADFCAAANADIEAKPPTIARLANLFRQAVQRKQALLKLNEVDASIGQAARSVANDIVQKSPNKLMVNNSYGRPNWHMGDLYELFELVNANKDNSTLVTGVAAGLDSLGIQDPFEEQMPIGLRVA